MAFAGGMYGLTIEKMFIDTMALSLESETAVKGMLAQDAYTPDFDVHDFRNDVTNEPAASGTYALGGTVLTTTDITIASPAATQLKYVVSNQSWTGATLTARGEVAYFAVGTSATDALIVANTFGADVASTAGTYSVTQPANGLFFIDYA